MARARSMRSDDLRLRTVEETAGRLRVCSRTIWRMIDSGTGPPIHRIGRRIFIRDDHLEAWLSSRVKLPRDWPKEISRP